MARRHAKPEPTATLIPFQHTANDWVRAAIAWRDYAHTIVQNDAERDGLLRLCEIIFPQAKTLRREQSFTLRVDAALFPACFRALEQSKDPGKVMGSIHRAWRKLEKPEPREEKSVELPSLEDVLAAEREELRSPVWS